MKINFSKWKARLRLRRIEAKADPMDRFQVDMGVRFKIFSQLGNKDVHAPAQEIIILSPYIQ